jgi:hypothetical protein
VFVTNIKFHMKKVLHIEVTRPKQNGFRAGQRPKQNGLFVYSDGLKLGPHGYMRKGGAAGTSELLYPNCVGGP